MKNLFQYLFFALILTFNLIQAQESVNVSGADVIGNNGNVTYSVGQAMYSTSSSSSGSITEGVQHAYEIFTLGLTESLIGIELFAYPNL